MADEKQESACQNEENENTTGPEGGNATLSDFITEQYEKQKGEGKMDPTDEISDERRNNFLARALGESQRMSMEAEKSQAKVAKLHAEFGAERFAAWRDEHASQVLLPHQVEAIARASQQNMDSYYANHPRDRPPTNYRFS